MKCLVPFLSLALTASAFAGNGGGLKPNQINPGATPSTDNNASAVPASTSTPAATSGERSGQVKQIETFVRSVLPAIIAAESGDESNLEFLKDKVTYFDTLRQHCQAAKTSHVETVAIIKKLDPSDITIDSVKNEARVNVMGNLSVSGNSSPTLWVVNVKISPTALAVSQIIAAKMPGN